MEYCLNDQTISSKSYAEKSPPLQKTAAELSIYICSKTLILPEWTIMRPFCCIPSCNGKSSWNLELSELSCGECWLIRQIDTTFPVTMVSYTETGLLVPVKTKQWNTNARRRPLQAGYKSPCPINSIQLIHCCLKLDFRAAGAVVRYPLCLCIPAGTDYGNTQTNRFLAVIMEEKQA